MDLVVKVLLKNGSEKYILIHVEFESKRPNRDFARRMYRYYCQLFLRYDSEIVPIVVFSDDARWKKQVTNSFEVSVAGTTFVRFQYHMIKLRTLNYRSFLGSQNPLAYALMAKMDYDRKEQARMKADFLRWILGSPVDPARKSLLVEFIETYVPLSGELLSEFEHLIHSEEQYAEVEQMVTVYEKRGIEQGIERGKRNLLLQLLQKKFGELSKDLEAAIGKVESAEQLDQLSLAVLDVSSLDEFSQAAPHLAQVRGYLASSL